MNSHNPYKIRNQQALYFITMTVKDWIDLFTRDQYRQIIIEALDYCRKNKDLRIWAYVIMTNHLHSILSTEKDSLSGILRDFKRHTTKQLLAAINQETESRRQWILKSFAEIENTSNRPDIHHQVWMHYHHPVELHSYPFTMQRLAYIHNNPVRAGFVDDPAAWVYSSQRNYMGLSPALEIDLLDI